MGSWSSDLILILAAPAFGSFAALVAERLPCGEDILFSRSRCRSCRHVLGPAELVPILSRAWLRGRCRWCGSGIPMGGLLVELSALGIALWAVAASPPAVATAALGWTLLALSLIDWRHMLLPDALTLPLLLAGLAWSVLSDPSAVTDSLVGAAAGGAVLMAISTGYRRLTGKDGLGLGDAKLFAAGGAWVGWQGLPGVLLVAALAGLLYAVLDGRLSEPRDRPLPFGPFLAAGIWLVWLYGPIAL